MLEDFERNRIASYFARVVDQTAPETTTTVDTVKGADIVTLLLAAGHGRVSGRIGRRILATVRAALSEETVTA